jgi:hypothetical protein
VLRRHAVIAFMAMATLLAFAMATIAAVHVIAD